MRLRYITKYSLVESNKALADNANKIDSYYEDNTFSEARQRMSAINHERWIITAYEITLVIQSTVDSK